ncbi:unnamed protein product [Fusarium graminearum]|uniref:Uncharacterized protein n=1 Tax=Gibberella zeae TaxID=5518 RepID=A0A9N8RE07_GIBZA|nr:unnamed protein product [Fusarium graminearum]
MTPEAGEEGYYQDQIVNIRSTSTTKTSGFRSHGFPAILMQRVGKRAAAHSATVRGRGSLLLPSHEKGRHSLHPHQHDCHLYGILRRSFSAGGGRFTGRFAPKSTVRHTITVDNTIPSRHTTTFGDTFTVRHTSTVGHASTVGDFITVGTTTATGN